MHNRINHLGVHCFVCFVWWFIARRCLCAICSIYNLGDRWRSGKGKNHLSVLFSNASTLPSCRYFIDTWKVSQVCIWRFISSWIDTIIRWQEEMSWIHVGFFLFQNLKLGYSEELTRQIVPNHFRICWLRTDPRTTTWEMSRECRSFPYLRWIDRNHSGWIVFNRKLSSKSFSSSLWSWFGGRPREARVLSENLSQGKNRSISNQSITAIGVDYRLVLQFCNSSEIVTKP